MNIILIKDKLHEGLGAVSKACGENQNLPILKNVLIQTDDNQIKLTATNLEVAVTFFIPGKIVNPGSITIPAQTFLNLITNLQSERISLEVKNESLEVKTENYQAKIQGLSAEDFPIIPQVKSLEEDIKIDSGVLRDSLEQVVVATQFSELRQELNSISMAFHLDTIVFAATDSFRLAEKTIYSQDFKSTINNEFSILIPLKTAQELLKILKNNETISISKDENQILFKTERFEFISRLLDGNFPDYKKVIPDGFLTESFLNKTEFLNALKLVSVFSSKVNEVKIKPSQNMKALEINSADESIGENNYILPAKVKGELKEVGFNWRYLMDGIKVINSEDIFFGLNEENKPAILKSVSDSSFFYILMPILKT